MAKNQQNLDIKEKKKKKSVNSSREDQKGKHNKEMSKP